MYIGYNLVKVREVMEGIVNAYNKTSKEIESKFESEIKPTLRNEWVGADEQTFEKNLVKRLNTLSDSALEMSTNAVKTMYSLAESWIMFQDQNVLQGDNVEVISKEAALKAQLGEMPNTYTTTTVVFSELEFSGQENFGLQNEGSAQTMGSALSSYVEGVRTLIKNLFDEIDTNTAFYGDQQGQIKTYMGKVADVLGELNTAIKDFDESMRTLTNGNYNKSDDSVSEKFLESETAMEEGLSELKDTRWLASN